MKQVYLTFSLLFCGTFMNVANAQCTAVQTFSEDFETFTTFPEHCWTGNQPTSPTTTISGTGTANQGLSLYSGFASGDIIIVSPEVSTIDGQHGLVFDITTGDSSTTVQIGTMTDNTDFTTFSAVGSAITAASGTYSTQAIAANPGHKYVAIKFIHGGGHKQIVLDNIKWTTNLSTSKFDANKVTIYPNPSTSIFYLNTKIDVKSIEVYNTLGQRVLTTDQKQINLENAANGVYVANVTAADGAQASYKIVKK